MITIKAPISLFGFYIHPAGYRDALTAIHDALKSKKRLIVYSVNIHIIVELLKNPGFRSKHQKANLLLADGMPLVWLSKLTKTPLPKRVNGTILAKRVLQTEHNIFLLGSSREVLRIMKTRYPNVCGIYSPPYTPSWSDKINKHIISMVNESGAKILFVGVGPLKQELWIYKYFNKTHAFVAMGVGSAFDMLSGKTPKAPEWMQKIGLEWVWRILLEPKRLSARYLEDILFLVTLFGSRFVLRIRKSIGQVMV